MKQPVQAKPKVMKAEVATDALSFGELLKQRVPLPVDSPAVQKRRTTPTSEDPEPVAAGKPDRTPGHRRRAGHQKRVAAARSALLAGECKPSVRGIGNHLGINNAAASAVIADLVDDGTLTRGKSGGVSLARKKGGDPNDAEWADAA